MDLFISYASEQRSVAEEIALALREEGHQVFFDRSDLPEGDAYNQRIREAIYGSELLIFLVSPEAVSSGRYTLTELRFAEEKWQSPAGHVLPVMVRPTEGTAMPAYLRAVVILRPAGNVAAEVLAAVDRLAKPRLFAFLRRHVVALGVLVLAALGLGIWQMVDGQRTCGEAGRLSDEAKLLHNAGDYAAAWDRYEKAAPLCPSNRQVESAQQQLAMDWLENIHATEGKTTFTDIANKLQPTLAKAALAKDNSRAADALAHLGWADFLRAREGQPGLDPMRYYQQALQRDPANAYANAFSGHYILVTNGSLQTAKADFAEAVVADKPRPFVRRLEIGGLTWTHTPALEDEVVRVANDMRAKGESLPTTGKDALASPIWNVYYDRLVRGAGRETFLAMLPPNDHLATFRAWFAAYDNSSNRYAYLLMLAQLQEHAGDRGAALTNYEAALRQLGGAKASSSAAVDLVRQAIRRLQKG
ncbi:MAG: toll/interleukin-1 receptor domain-containing protein [Betaproteobacteria bacterium]